MARRIAPKFVEGAGEQYLVMYVGEALEDEISPTDYQQLTRNLYFARKAKVVHCDVRRRHNCMRFRFGDAPPVCQLVDWDLSVDGGERVSLVSDSAQRREAPANIQRQLAEDARQYRREQYGVASHAERYRVEVEWDYCDDAAMLLEYMWEVATGTGEQLNGVKTQEEEEKKKVNLKRSRCGGVVSMP